MTIHKVYLVNQLSSLFCLVETTYIFLLKIILLESSRILWVIIELEYETSREAKMAHYQLTYALADSRQPIPTWLMPIIMVK